MQLFLPYHLKIAILASIKKEVNNSIFFDR